MDLHLKDKTVIVTGAAQGIGAVIYQALVAEGAQPVGIDVQPYAGSELEKQLEKEQRQPWFYRCDAADEQELREIFETIATKGNVYGLVNNAGILGGDAAHGGRTVAAWNKIMHHNAQSAYVATEAAHPHMTDGGSIVNISGITPLMVAPEVVLLPAAKGAMNAITVAYAVTLAPKNIRVNALLVGNVMSEKNRAQYVEHPELIAGFHGRTPLKRSVEPTEVADAVLYLLSDRSSAITGAEVVIDCGYTRAIWDPAWTQKPLDKVYAPPAGSGSNR